MSHVTRTPLSRSNGQSSRSLGRFTHRGLNASGSCSGERVNVLDVGNYCYVAVYSAALRASAPTEGGDRIPSLKFVHVPVPKIWLIFDHGIKRSGDLDVGTGASVVRDTNLDPTSYGVSAIFLCRVMGKHVSNRRCHVINLTFDIARR